MATPVDEFTVDALTVQVHASEAEMGRAAAERAACLLRHAVADRGEARVVLATGNSQLRFTEALRHQDVPWHRVVAFHMDEYIGIGADHPASFRRWMRERVEEPLGVRMEYIHGDVPDIAEECDRYESLLREAPIDLVCMGIGENGHLAFNEPGFADFDDPRWVRVVELTPESQAQQVGEGHFPDLARTPTHAISLTIPALLSAREIQVCTPESRKAAAVEATLSEPISPACPATVLRRTPNAVLFIELASAPASLAS